MDERGLDADSVTVYAGFTGRTGIEGFERLLGRMGALGVWKRMGAE